MFSVCKENFACTDIIQDYKPVESTCYKDMFNIENFFYIVSVVKYMYKLLHPTINKYAYPGILIISMIHKLELLLLLFKTIINAISSLKQ